MQIVGSNSNKRFRISITCRRDLPLYSKGYNMLKNNINMLPEKLNAKRLGLVFGWVSIF
jgi:hypothetical protein